VWPNTFTWTWDESSQVKSSLPLESIYSERGCAVFEAKLPK